MKALVYHRDQGRKAWEHVPDPKIINPTDAIVQVDITTICGTDLHILKGDVPAVTDGRILGHEGVGTITEVGQAVGKLAVGEWMLAAGFFGSHGPQNQNARPGRRGQQRGDPFERVGIAPLHVIEIKQKGFASPSDRGAQRFVEVQPLPALAERTGFAGRERCNVLKLFPDLRHQPSPIRSVAAA